MVVALLVELLVSYLFYKNPSWDFMGDFNKTLPVSEAPKEGLAEEVPAPETEAPKEGLVEETLAAQPAATTEASKEVATTAKGIEL